LIPWLANFGMRAYCAVFGRHAAYFHLMRIIRGSKAAECVQEGVADFEQEDEDDDDDEDDPPRPKRRRPKLLPVWGQVARKAWRAHDDE